MDPKSCQLNTKTVATLSTPLHHTLKKELNRDSNNGSKVLPDNN